MNVVYHMYRNADSLAGWLSPQSPFIDGQNAAAHFCNEFPEQVSMAVIGEPADASYVLIELRISEGADIGALNDAWNRQLEKHGMLARRELAQTSTRLIVAELPNP